MASTVTELLRRRFGGKKDNIIYQTFDVSLDGTSYLDTGIQLMSGFDFDLFFKFTLTKAPATSDRYLSVRQTSGGIAGIDLRYASSRLDLVITNSDNYFSTSITNGDTIEISIVRQNGTITATFNGETKERSGAYVSNTLMPLVIGATSVYTNKTQLYINELTIKAL